MKSGNFGQDARFVSPLTVSTPLRPVFKTTKKLSKYGHSDVRRNIALGNLFWFAILLMAAALVFSVVLRADTVPVRHREGLVHGFLVLRTLDGEIIANGDQTQVARGDRITSRVVFHFKDGSLHEE